MLIFEDNVILGAAGHLFHASSQPHGAPTAWFPSLRRLLEVVAPTQPLSSLGRLRKVSRNCSNSFADSLQLLSAVSHLCTHETSITCSQFYTQSLLKRENYNEAVYLFQAFLLEAWIP